MSHSLLEAYFDTSTGFKTPHAYDACTMRLFIDGKELFALDAMLQRAILEADCDPSVLVIAGKVRAMIKNLKVVEVST